MDKKKWSLKDEEVPLDDGIDDSCEVEDDDEDEEDEEEEEDEEDEDDDDPKIPKKTEIFEGQVVQVEKLVKEEEELRSQHASV